MDNKMNNASNPGPFTDSDLPIDDEGRVYHLEITGGTVSSRHPDRRRPRTSRDDRQNIFYMISK